MTPEQKIELLELRDRYRRDLMRSTATFPEQSSIQDLVDAAVFLQSIIASIENNEPLDEIVRHTEVVETVYPEDQPGG